MNRTICLIFLIVLATLVHSQNKMNYESCKANEECRSRNCVKGKCAPLKCRNDKTCLEAGLFDHYCRRRGFFRIFRAECVPKRGKGQKCSRDRQCLSNRCIPIIRRCT
ncbi:hypothetical protein BpHYR1_031261 [Brachionus plicatilis]|uniref:Uncharacterized protein n=1 Tax=Brachionus plicatilis TaxID=10195 RepID=A0A3M7T7P0_BRAPC|nr:hypothetical protein BpHYR1_031261 [Brachionus plicatilis]